MTLFNRSDRVNSLLKEVLAEVVRQDVKNPKIHELTSVTRVEVTRDLHFAKVYVSVIATQAEKDATVKALQTATGYIAVTAAKKVTLRYFPQLTFKLDESVDHYMHIDKLLAKINTDKKLRS